jgi:hypothetical protein
MFFSIWTWQGAACAPSLKASAAVFQYQSLDPERQPSIL